MPISSAGPLRLAKFMDSCISMSEGKYVYEKNRESYLNEAEEIMLKKPKD